MLRPGWILLLVWGLVSCSGSGSPDADAEPDRLQVVSTSTIIADWTERIGGGAIDHRGLLQPGADPHIYEPVPTDSRVLEQADLILYNGYNLEPGLIKLITATGIKARKLAVAEGIVPLDLTYQGHAVPDPHVWGDVQNTIQMVATIRQALIELSPQHAAQFTDEAEQLTTELQQLHAWVQAQVQTIPAQQRVLVTTHDAFQYYAKAYGLTIGGSLIGISTEEQPSAQTVKRLADTIRSLGVPAIFAETTINPTLIQTVATEAGVQLSERELYSDSVGTPDSEAGSYITMIEANTRTIVEALGGTYTPFEMNGDP
jgi:manganese/iron transport system substrate-binding protein